MADKVKNYGITGTAANIELGKGGTIINGSDANVMVLTDASSNTVHAVVAQGTEDSHAVTKSQLDLIGSERIRYQTFTVAYDDEIQNLVNVAANTRIVRVVVESDAEWSNAGANTTITVGDTDDTDRLFTSFDPEIQTIDSTSHLYSSETTLRAVINAGGATSGNARITVWYTGELTAAPPIIIPAQGYRYWRILFGGVSSTNRVGLSEIEFLDKRYYRRVTGGTVSASGQTSTSVEAEDANDGFYGTIGTPPSASGFWQSNTGATPIWYMRDAGEGNEFICEGVSLARANVALTFSGFDVQYSNDNVNWTTEWTVSDVSPLSNNAFGPVTFTNTNIAVFDPTPGFDTANVVLWIKSYDGAFTGNLTGAATNGDAVQTMTNHAAGYAGANVLIKQTTVGNRPIFRTGGAAGMPYLEFDNTQAHHFETIPYVMPTDLTDNYPGATGILADITDPANNTLTVYPVLGQAATDNPRKNNFVYVNNATGDFFLRAHKNALTVYTNEINGVHTLVHAWSTYSRNQFIRREDDNRVDWVTNTGTTTYDSSAVSTSELFKTVESSGTTYYMKGKVYELILDLGTAVGNTSTDFYKAQFNGYAIQQYLEGRRLYGAPSPPSPPSPPDLPPKEEN